MGRRLEDSPPYYDFGLASNAFCSNALWAILRIKMGVLEHGFLDAGTPVVFLTVTRGSKQGPRLWLSTGERLDRYFPASRKYGLVFNEGWGSRSRRCCGGKERNDG